MLIVLGCGRVELQSTRLQYITAQMTSSELSMVIWLHCSKHRSLKDSTFNPATTTLYVNTSCLAWHPCRYKTGARITHERDFVINGSVLHHANNVSCVTLHGCIIPTSNTKPHNRCAEASPRSTYVVATSTAVERRRRVTSAWSTSRHQPANLQFQRPPDNVLHPDLSPGYWDH